MKEKLARALEHVALGNPDRLRYHVSDLAEHLADGAELVRYHLTTALVVVECAHPDSLVDDHEAFVERLDDESKYVSGRAAEGIGLLARASEDVSAPLDPLRECLEDEPFVAERARFAVRAFDDEAKPGEAPDDIRSIEAIGERTEEIVEDITSPDENGECPVCGLSVPENGPPMCPGCGAPR